MFSSGFDGFYDMMNTELMACRERLLALRARLLGDMTQMENNALNNDRSRTTRMPTDMAELGSDNFEQELTLSLLRGDKDSLGQIEAAIERIDDGSYGRCRECDTKIPKSRLDALPYTEFCIRCASEQEQGLIVFGFRKASDRRLVAR